jgi:hypothetical protein
MTTDTEPDPPSATDRAAIVRDLGSLARELVVLAQAADRASARGDTDSMFDAGSEIVSLAGRFGARYRMLLGVGRGPAALHAREGSSL